MTLRTSVCCTRRRATISSSPWCASWSAGSRSRSSGAAAGPVTAWWCASRPTWASGSHSAARRPSSRRSSPRPETSCATPSTPAGTRTPRTSSASRSTATAGSTRYRSWSGCSRGVSAWLHPVGAVWTPPSSASMCFAGRSGGRSPPPLLFESSRNPWTRPCFNAHLGPPRDLETVLGSSACVYLAVGMRPRVRLEGPKLAQRAPGSQVSWQQNVGCWRHACRRTVDVTQRYSGGISAASSPSPSASQPGAASSEAPGPVGAGSEEPSAATSEELFIPLHAGQTLAGLLASEMAYFSTVFKMDAALTAKVREADKDQRFFIWCSVLSRTCSMAAGWTSCLAFRPRCLQGWGSLDRCRDVCCRAAGRRVVGA
uniref:Potassium channel tetramerisation domain containing 15 n=1 Tax=Pan troglodytes TaxID=9598 RepID=K7CE84_PANTR